MKKGQWILYREKYGEGKWHTHLDSGTVRAFLSSGGVDYVMINSIWYEIKDIQVITALDEDPGKND